MKVGIDSYSFHRYFGETYPGLQIDPGKRWDMKDDFIPFAISLDVDEVALETLFFPALDQAYCEAVKGLLDDAGLERVIGWGHPDGLHGGSDEDALADMIRHIPRAAALGAPIMRMVASSMVYVNEPKGPQIENSARMLKEAVQVAADHDVTLAIENHIDFTSHEILQILERVDSDRLRVNFDTGNALRMHEDPVQAARLLAPHCVATHTKDITVRTTGGSPSDRFAWWPATPAGEGLIDIVGIARELKAVDFQGSLAIELDLMAQPWDERSEEENVAASIAYLKQVAQTVDPEPGTPVGNAL